MLSNHVSLISIFHLSLFICSFVPHLVTAKTKSVKVEGGPECILCEFAMRELDSILGDNATKVCGGYDGGGDE